MRHRMGEWWLHLGEIKADALIGEQAGRARKALSRIKLPFYLVFLFVQLVILVGLVMFAVNPGGLLGDTMRSVVYRISISLFVTFIPFFISVQATLYFLSLIERRPSFIIITTITLADVIFALAIFYTSALATILIIDSFRLIQIKSAPFWPAVLIMIFILRVRPETL